MNRLPRATAGALFSLLAASALAEERHFTLPIEKGALLGERTLSVVENDDVTILFQSDQALDLHLHGYDLEWELRAGEPLSVTFTASYSGRFPVEAHGLSNRVEDPLFYLEVYPR